MLNVTSEIGTLRRVVVHTPGQEVRRMTPALRHDLLFDDILYLDLARHEHEAFRRLLSVIVPPEDVLDSADLLRDVVEDEVTRHSLVESVCRLGVGPNTDPQALCREMMDAEPDQLVSWLIEGKPHPGRHEELTSYLSEMPYQLPPIPNLMFMRDPCAVVGNGLVVGHMAYPARQREALLMRYAYQAHPLAGGEGETPLWFDMLSPYAIAGGDPTRKEATIEGGDVLVIRSDLVLVGVSERTSSQAVDALARGLARSGAPVKTLYAVIMPRQRSTMHLDTIFTMMSHEDLMVYPPLIMPGGGEQVGIVRITINRDGSTHLQPMKKSLVNCLEEELGRPLNPVFCGGNSRLYQEREQWTDGANTFVLRPGLILGYERNPQTYKALEAAGYRIIPEGDIVRWQVEAGSNREWVTNETLVEEIRTHPERKYAIQISGLELSRARGGPRCMTMPLAREEL
ncbi:MAG TPA: arginine deiminase family protein [Chloroflexia bacterium]|nr:arginine deiminase family protein [Chloroflexia bacterium]